MIWIDTGPLVSLIDRGDLNHEACVAVLSNSPDELLATTWPCFAEALYLLGNAGGFPFQAPLWQLWRDQELELIDLSPDEAELAAQLMEMYLDHPMDLADATLVAAADFRNSRKIITLDTHFFAFRLRDGSVLEVVLPGKTQRT